MFYSLVVCIRFSIVSNFVIFVFVFTIFGGVCVWVFFLGFIY